MVSGPREIKVQRTPLPGIGLRLDFLTESGRRLGVIHRQHGGVELFMSRPDDPDLTTASVTLTGAETETLRDLFGGSAFSHELSHLQAAVSGVAIDWLAIDSGSRFDGQPLGATQLRTRTGVSVVAVIRNGDVVPSPTPAFVFAAGDVAVAVGTVDGLGAAADILRAEP